MVSSVLSSAPSLARTGRIILQLNINMHAMLFKSPLHKHGVDAYSKYLAWPWVATLIPYFHQVMKCLESCKKI